MSRGRRHAVDGSAPALAPREQRPAANVFRRRIFMRSFVPVKGRRNYVVADVISLCPTDETVHSVHDQARAHGFSGRLPAGDCHLTNGPSQNTVGPLNG